MLKKYTVFFLSAAFLLTLACFFASRQSAAVNSEMLDAAAMLPDSDVVVTMDFDRTFNVAATSLLSQDAKKIEHLKNLMKTVENQLGVNPYQIRQIAAGFKLPSDNSKDFLTDSEFTAIVRTTDSNANLLDDWSRKIDLITNFKDEQTASREFMDNFKSFRAFKFDKAAPEEISAATQKFQDALKKTQDVSAKLSALPKLAASAESVSALKAKNQLVSGDLKEIISVLQADTEMQTLRETSIKLLNRWNAVTLDDAQRTAKLAAITKESKGIYPAFEEKHANAKKLESLLAAMEPATGDGIAATADSSDDATLELDTTLVSLGKLPATKTAKTTELKVLAEGLDNLHGTLQSRLESLNFQTETLPEIAETAPVVKPKPTSFYETLKKSERRETVNGKQMLVIDMTKFDEPNAEKSPDKEPAAKETIPNLAIGFLDDKTMVVGFEKTVAPFLKRDANYKNQKVLEMLGAAQNSLFAFVINSKATGQIFAQAAKMSANAAAPKVSESSFYDNLTKDINIYGSVNYDGDKATNDVSMSVGFYKEIVGNLSAPDNAKADAETNSEADSTFEFAGYQVGKDIFYDLFNSFKAVQASMTFKFEKKKVAALVRSAPGIIENIRTKNTKNSAAQKNIADVSRSKPSKLESAADLLTAPQFYVDLAELLTKNSKK